jgi:hypothetical protein
MFDFRIKSVVCAVALVLTIAPAHAQSATECAASTSYPGCTYPEPRAQGMFDRLLVGGYLPKVSEQVATKRFWGMPLRNILWDLVLRDDKGTWYYSAPTFQLKDDGSQVGVGWHGYNRSLRVGATGELEPDVRISQWTGAVKQTLSSDGTTLQFSAMTPAGAETIANGDKNFSYRSASSQINLDGTRSGGGTSFKFPWREPGGTTHEFFFNIDGYRVEGTYYGQHVGERLQRPAYREA